MKTGSSPAYIRYSIRRDLPEMLAIEEDSFNVPWTEDDFVNHIMNAEPLSEQYLLSRKQCCGNVCKNCPYFPRYTAGSTYTNYTILSAPVSLLEHYGLSARTINIIEAGGYFTIGDLRKIDGKTKTRNVGKKLRIMIRDALIKLFSGECPMKLNFDNTT